MADQNFVYADHEFCINSLTEFIQNRQDYQYLLLFGILDWISKALKFFPSLFPSELLFLEHRFSIILSYAAQIFWLACGNSGGN